MVNISTSVAVLLSERMRLQTTHLPPSEYCQKQFGRVIYVAITSPGVGPFQRVNPKSVQGTKQMNPDLARRWDKLHIIYETSLSVLRTL